MSIQSAENALLEWTAGAYALALLRAVHDDGLFAALKDPLTVEEIAAQRGLDPRQTRRVCMALEALQIVRREGETYQLTEGWAWLGADDRPALLANRLAVTEPLLEAIAGCFNPPLGFDAVSAEEALTLARSAWGMPNSPEALRSFRELDASMPAVRDVWQAGGRHAEFGCGAGRDLLRIAVMYPDVTAVGYEILPHVIEEGRAQAAQLGVGDRVSFRVEDVQDVSAQDEFDTLLWSQMFFPPETRPATIASIKRALKPGGLLLMVLMGDLPDLEQVEPALATCMQMLMAIAYRRWNIYWPPSADVRRELEREGFTHVDTIPHPRTTYIVMRLDS